VIKETPENPAVRSRAVQRLLLGIFHPLDVHVFTPEEFEDAAYEELSFVRDIIRQNEGRSFCDLEPQCCYRTGRGFQLRSWRLR
jgi:hypothetical protein